MTSEFLPIIDLVKCIGCELCVRACPNQVLALIDDVAAIVNPAACNYSGVCQEICPTEAVSLTYEIVFVETRREAKGQSIQNTRPH
jgi:formate hydrogenlyase subunit 6/NADH:ubiquinone oxidoreductase subunit I